MYLRLLDTDKYISKYKTMEVENANILSANKKSFDEQGLWSEVIFGRLGSNDRRFKFGYINLNTKIISPILYKIIQTISPIMRNILLQKKNYIIENHKVIESKDGLTGLNFLTNNIDKFKFVDIIDKQEKLKDAEYLDSLAPNLIIIDKLLVLPAGSLRDISFNIKKKRQYVTEVNELYEQILSLTNQLKLTVDQDTREILTEGIQKLSLKILTWLQNQLKGKAGIYRSKVLKKSIDYSGRVVATSSPDIEMGKIGLPYHMVLILFEPFFLNYVFQKNNNCKQEIEFFLNKTDIALEDVKHLTLSIYKNDSYISSRIKNVLVEAAKEVAKDKLILVKRDPVVSRTSYYSAEITVLSEGRTAVVNPISCEQQGLDFDGDSVAIYALFTKQATEQAKKLCPRYSKESWAVPISIKDHNYPLTLDAISTIYIATRD